jgi:catechol 2,3-dioxygenase-like lactoylglutathione lyase family enzyme
MALSLKSVRAITLFVEDIHRSSEFYERVFDVEAFHEEEAGTVVLTFENMFLRLLTRSEAEKELFGKVALGDPGSGVSSELATPVEDAQAAHDHLVDLGVPIVFGPVDRPWGVTHVAFRDPDGHLWVLSADTPES